MIYTVSSGTLNSFWVVCAVVHTAIEYIIFNIRTVRWVFYVYSDVTLVTFDKQSNARRIEVES